MYLRCMKLVLVSATAGEIQPVLHFFNLKEGFNVLNGHELSIVISGVGMVATAFSLGAEFAVNLPDLAVNAGIAGSFKRSLRLGEVVRVKDDRFSELGAEDGDSFLSIESLGFGTGCVHEVPVVTVKPYVSHLKEVSAITVNKVHGNAESIAETTARLDPAIETMEGAAFFYACQDKNIPSVQIRAVSNYVERRNRAAWDIPLAVKNLNNELIDLFKKIL